MKQHYSAKYNMYHLSKLISVLTANGWLLKILLILLAWFAPALEVSLLLYALAIIDAVTGIAKSIKEGKKYNSKGLVPTIEKIGWYTIYILVIHAFQLHFVKDAIDIFKILIAIPIIREVTSIVENIESLTGINIATQAKNVLSGFFSKISKIEKVEDKAEKKVDNPDE